VKFSDLASSALKAAQIIAAGDTPSAQDVIDAQTICNQMLESWGAERLNVFTLTRTIFNLQASKQTYSLGAGGDFNMARPANIEYVSYIYNANPSFPLETQIKMYSDEDWARIPIKNVQNVLPEGVYDDGSFPLRNLSYWPIPNDSSVQTVIGAWTALTQFTDLTTDFTFPPGYIEAIKYNLAVRIAAEWPGNISPTIAALAQDGIARIKTLNVPIAKQKMPAEYSGGQGGHYDWRIDGYR